METDKLKEQVDQLWHQNQDLLEKRTRLVAELDRVHQLANKVWSAVLMLDRGDRIRT